MNLIAPRTLRAFYEEHKEAEAVMKVWQKQIQGKDYANWQALKETFSSIDLVSAKGDIPVVIFDLGGNKYRIVARVSYVFKTLHIKHVLTHKEYDEWNKKGKPL